MIAKLHLLLNNLTFDTMEVQLTDFEDKIVYESAEERAEYFKNVVEIRKMEVETACQKLKVLNIKAIIKCQYFYSFFLQIKSSV